MSMSHTFAAPEPRVMFPRTVARPSVEIIRMVGATVKKSRDQEIFGEGEPADRVFQVLKGVVRCFKLLSDGRRQICDFYVPGDIFGLEPGLDRRATAEAVSDVVLLAAPRATLMESSDPDAARRLWALAMADLRRSQDHTLTLGRRSATERVASFLVDLAERLGDTGHVELPISRQDMADYLGLTIETVSRTLTQLQASGHIALSGRRSIDLRRPAALAELCA